MPMTKPMVSLLALFLAAPLAADPVLLQPIDCELGSSCYIQHLVDRDPGPAVRDHRCGNLSYDGHKGTDFALPNLAAMQSGVAVLAAAPGVVRGVRDEMEDRPYAPEDAAAIEGRECGNGLVLDHGGGWVSQYCHMKRGSLRVVPGQRVAAGTELGQVGMSGKTQFPHLHFSLRLEGRVVDPFAPTTLESCDLGGKPLWQMPPAYQPGGVIDLGFAPGLPSFEAIKAGEATLVGETDLAALVTWAYAYGVQAGDQMLLRLSGPEGVLIEKQITLERTQAQLFRALGRKRPAGGWPEGTYHAEVLLLRAGQELDRLERQITLPTR